MCTACVRRVHGMGTACARYGHRAFSTYHIHTDAYIYTYEVLLALLVSFTTLYLLLIGEFVYSERQAAHV